MNGTEYVGLKAMLFTIPKFRDEIERFNLVDVEPLTGCDLNKNLDLHFHAPVNLYKEVNKSKQNSALQNARSACELLVDQIRPKSLLREVHWIPLTSSVSTSTRL